MPTDRFYRLPEKKRKAIRDAARKEFARVPYEKASINQIIKNAGISRGSFYTYFSDKQDLMEFILKEDMTQVQLLCENTLDLNGGEYIGMLKVLFEYLVDRLQSTSEMMSMVKNVFSSNDETLFPDYPTETVTAVMNGKEEVNQQWLLDRLDRKRLRLQTEEELQALIMLGTNAMIASIKQYYRYPDRLDEVRRLFERKLDIIWNGVYQLQPAG